MKLQDVTVNLTVPKELLPALQMIVEELRRAVGEGNDSVSITVSDNISTPVTNPMGTYISDTYIETNQCKQKPTLEEVVRYCEKRGSTVDGRRFYSWAEKHNWTDAKGNPITDWKGKITEWEGYRLEKAPSPSTTNKMLNNSYNMMLEWANE